MMSSSKGKGNTTSYKPGQSGNPKGRPKGTVQVSPLRELLNRKKALHGLVFEALAKKEKVGSEFIPLFIQLLNLHIELAKTPLEAASTTLIAAAAKAREFLLNLGLFDLKHYSDEETEEEDEFRPFDVKALSRMLDDMKKQHYPGLFDDCPPDKKDKFFY